MLANRFYQINKTDQKNPSKQLCKNHDTVYDLMQQKMKKKCACFHSQKIVKMLPASGPKRDRKEGESSPLATAAERRRTKVCLPFKLSSNLQYIAGP